MYVDLEVFGDVECVLGEGPVWLPESSELVWLDIVVGRIHRSHPGADAAMTIQLPHMIGAVAPASGGRLVVATEDGFAEIDAAGVECSINPFLAAQPDARMNDGKCDPVGHFVAGTTSLSGAQGSAGLYRLEDDGSATNILGGLSVSNGLAWGPDGSTLFHIDTPDQVIRAWEYHPDAVLGAEPRVVVDTGTFAGFPDGMAIDVEGNLWVAFWDGYAVRCFSPEGQLLEEIILPVSRPTSCAFGGEDLKTLYITTARFELGSEALEKQPLAGRVLSCQPGPTGQVPISWSGLASRGCA